MWHPFLLKKETKRTTASNLWDKSFFSQCIDQSKLLSSLSLKWPFYGQDHICEWILFWILFLQFFISFISSTSFHHLHSMIVFFTHSSPFHFIFHIFFFFPSKKVIGHILKTGLQHSKKTLLKSFKVSAFQLLIYIYIFSSNSTILDYLNDVIEINKELNSTT